MEDCLMTDEPHVGGLRWQGEPQNSPVELWDGKQWVLVGCSTPTDEELKALYWEAFKNAAPCGADQSWLAGLRAVARWGRPSNEPDGPAVPDGREPASVIAQPTDKELLELMPETMRDEFSYAARTCSNAMGGRVKPGIFRVALNTAALEYAQAVLARYARPAIEPVPQQRLSDD
jgi:hypothetical protein